MTVFWQTAKQQDCQSGRGPILLEGLLSGSRAKSLPRQINPHTSQLKVALNWGLPCSTGMSTHELSIRIEATWFLSVRQEWNVMIIFQNCGIIYKLKM